MMAARACLRGRKVVFRSGKWRYETTGNVAAPVRQCVLCRQHTAEIGLDKAKGGFVT